MDEAGSWKRDTERLIGKEMLIQQDDRFGSLGEILRKKTFTLKNKKVTTKHQQKGSFLV